MRISSRRPEPRRSRLGDRPLDGKRTAMKREQAACAQPPCNATDVWCYPNASVKGRTRSAERVEAHPRSLSLAKRL